MPDVFAQPVKYEFTGPNDTDSLGNEIRFPLVLPHSETESKRIVTEIVSWAFDTGGAQTKMATSAQGINASLSFRPLTAAENDHDVPTATVGDIGVLDRINIRLHNNGTPATSHFTQDVFRRDLTGGTGFGVLLPGDRLYFNVTAGGTLNISAHTLGLVVHYRQHLVGLTEFYGLLAMFMQNPAA